MANVLPPAALKSVRRFYLSRVILMASFVLLACGIVAALALVPAYAIVSVESPEEEFLSEALSDVTANREAILRARELVVEVKPLASSTRSLLPSIEAALLARSSGIAIHNIHLTRGEPSVLLVGGIASSREDINAYRVALLEDGRFSSVTVPIRSLTGTDDGRFTMTITGDF